MMATTAQPNGQRRLENALSAACEAVPLADGKEHPAERVIAAAIDSEDHDTFLGWITSFCLDYSANPAFAAAVFLCVARWPRFGTPVWRADLVRGGLAMDDVGLRDAVVQAAESWGDPGLRLLLETHSEPVPWLDEYVRGVIDDLAK